MLALITYPDEKIKTKVNFFCDYFNLAANHIGKYPKWDFENPLSIVDKIIFQIETNPENRNRYLANHLKNYHFKENEYTKQFKVMTKLRPLIADYLKVKNKNEWLNNNPEFLKLLKRLKSDLNQNMLNKAVDFIIRYLRCTHDLDFHLEDFKYLILIIISELKFREKSKQEVNNLISKIMTKNVKQFPLPQKILTEKNKAQFKILSSDFINNRTFKEQFEGIKNFNDKNDLNGYFIFQIYNLELNKNDLLTFDDVKICHPTNEIFDNFKEKIGEVDHWTKYASEKNISLAITQGNITNYDSGLQSAINKVQVFLNYINNKLESNCYINIFSYKSTLNFERIEGYGYKSDTTKKKLSEYDLHILKLDNPFERLVKVNSQAKTKFLSSEKFYQRALISNEPSDYWHYLECLIPKDKKGNQYVKQVKSVSSAILFLAHQSRFPTHIATCVFNLLHGYSEERTKNNLSYNERNKIAQNWSNSDIIKIGKEFNHHPIIRSLIKDYENRGDIDNLYYVYQIYYYMINELYEIRNAYIHSGIKNEYSNKKIQHILPMYISTIRSFLIDKIENERNKKIETIINNIKIEANKILPVKIDDYGITLVS